LNSVYRLLRAPFAATPFDGEGSYRYGGRWSRPGTRLVYTAEHLSLAMIEYLAHVDADRPPKDIMLAKAEVPEGVSRIQMKPDDLPQGWRTYPPPEALATVGDAFVKELRAAILIVPSALAVSDNNWILNPAHPDFHKIRFHAAVSLDYDPRLLKAGR
jgi:RES domain-containing protein